MCETLFKVNSEQRNNYHYLRLCTNKNDTADRYASVDFVVIFLKKGDHNVIVD